MKKILAGILVLCLMAGLCACSALSDDKIKAVRNVSFDGTELTVKLGENKSTGYEWVFEIFGTCIEPSINRSFKVTGSNGNAVGEVSIGFEGKSEGTAVIVFTTPNGWDGTGAGDGYTVTVEVDADGIIRSADGNEGANEPAPTTEPALKTAITVAELAEGTYTGTLSGVEIATENDSEDEVDSIMYTTLSPAEITVTIENGQITLYSETVANSSATILGVQTPQAPEFRVILSGSLPLQQSGDAVTAEGEVSALGESSFLHYTDGVFDCWEIKERAEDAVYTCAVNIAMENGIPVATITVGKRFVRTATIPLALAPDAEAMGSNEPLSAPYAELLRSEAYQYTYYLEYEGVLYNATTATYNGMVCRKVVSEDGSISQRTVTIDGSAWKVNDLTGNVADGGAESVLVLPDYASSLTFVTSGTLETGAICDAYDFEIQGEQGNLVFVFSPEGTLVELVMTSGGETLDMQIVSFSSVGNDTTLFDVPQ